MQFRIPKREQLYGSVRKSSLDGGEVGNSSEALKVNFISNVKAKDLGHYHLSKSHCDYFIEVQMLIDENSRIGSLNE